jgi:hypothetical protein
MNKKNDKLLVEFDGANLPNKPYVVRNDIFKGSDVTVKVKIPGNHDSWSPFDNQPFYFQNVGLAITSPDRYQPSKSRNPEALKRSKEGEVIMYEKDNICETLAYEPWINQYPNHTLVVPTFYGYNGENYTLTYYLKQTNTDDVEESK